MSFDILGEMDASNRAIVRLEKENIEKDERITALEKERDALEVTNSELYNMLFAYLDGWDLSEDAEIDHDDIVKALEAHNLEQQLKILKEYANTCGVLRQEPSTRGLHELIMDLEAKALKVGK